MNQPVLTVNDLNVYFHTRQSYRLSQVLSNISFKLYQGETLGIIGESGSGKSITLLSMLGLIGGNPGICSGEILLNNQHQSINLLQDIDQAVFIKQETNCPEINKNTGFWKKHIEPRFKKVRGNTLSMIFQNPRLAFNPYISIGKQISETIRLHTTIKNKKTAKEKAIEWLTAVKMDAPHIRYNNNPYGLSGGMCQRALIAMALSSEARIILADEPTSGLDATVQSEILDLLQELKVKYQKSMLIVSHDLGVMQKISDRLLVYYQGHIVETASTQDILHRPEKLHPYTQILLNAHKATGFIEESKIQIQNVIVSGCPFHTHCQFVHELNNKCLKEKPDLKEISPGHYIACWKYQA